MQQNLPKRAHPLHGVNVGSTAPTIVFLTVCTKGRQRWLTTPENHSQLCTIWRAATAWHVGRYVLIPDHLHLFAAPGDPELPLDNWVRYWKSRFSKLHEDPAHRWQSDHWDRRLRTGESYETKSAYVMENPVRQGLVQQADDWPFRGEIFRLDW